MRLLTLRLSNEPRLQRKHSDARIKKTKTESEEMMYTAVMSDLCVLLGVERSEVTWDFSE